ncbi:MAG: hypothetical protein ACE5G9_14170 [Nitrospinales bacterium]
MIKETIINYKNYRWFWFNLTTLSLLLLFYIVDNPIGGKRGDTFLGYAYGILAMFGILLLMWLGVRKRTYTSSQGTLVDWLSAHIWIGLSLLLIVPMHSGFQFNLNIHTLAYGFMVATILSGIWGAINYVHLPSQIPSHRGGDKAKDIADQIHEVTSDLNALGEDLSDKFIEMLEFVDFTYKPRLPRLVVYKKRRLSSKENKIKDFISDLPQKERDEAIKAIGLVAKKRELISKLQREIGVDHWLKVWLRFHLPLSFALVFSVAIHIFSVFYYR